MLARLASGAYESASEVMRAALRALDREEGAINAVLRARIKASIEDPWPSPGCGRGRSGNDALHGKREQSRAPCGALRSPTDHRPFPTYRAFTGLSPRPARAIW
ncbi:hypothetical protein EOA31_35990 [Mesorhizobium sp. M4B.F.Ca.ET.049.02.1.2]|nr:hypothetical protein EOA31_35990 [Mesorhizobium sp. M4B.F.Ca.ET.049.02.1.2]